MPRRFKEYVLDDPNAERERGREEKGKVLLRLLFFAKVHTCSVTLVAFAPAHDRGQARAFLACWRRRGVAKVQRFAAAAAAAAFFLSFFLC